MPRRLTWHPGADVVQGFTADGKSVLFTSPRAVFTSRYTQLYTVPVEGGPEVRLPIPHADRASYSSDGKRIAYNPLSPRFLQWKRYRGGAGSHGSGSMTRRLMPSRVPQPESRCQRRRPDVMGDAGISARTRRRGQPLRVDTKSSGPAALTRHRTSVLTASAAPGGSSTSRRRTAPLETARGV